MSIEINDVEQSPLIDGSPESVRQVTEYYNANSEGATFRTSVEIEELEDVDEAFNQLKSSIFENSSWLAKAACKGQAELFFGPGEVRQETSSERDKRRAQAKALCRTCIVREQCDNYLLS